MTLAPARAITLLIVAATALRLVLAGIVDLGLDEAYAVAVGRHFQLSWFDHPPLVFWTVGALSALFGPDVPGLVLRLPFIALSAGTTWLLYRLTERHFGGRAGLWAALLFTLAPFFFLSAGSWIVPDGPLVFFLVVAALALTRIVLDETGAAHWRDWLIAGAALGLALLSKYHAALFLLGAVACFALVPRLRVWFARPQPYVSALLAAVLFLPVLVWNAQNGWASFAFQLGRGQPVGGSTPELVLRLFATEAAYLLPTTAALLIAAIVWAVLQRGLARVSVVFFLSLALPLIVVLDLPRFWTWQSYAHWAMPGWMFLLPLAGAMLVRWQERWQGAGPVVGVVSALQFFVVIGAVVLLLSSLRLRDPGIDSFRIEAGSWTGVAAGIEEAGGVQPGMFLLARRWSDASRIAEALRPDVPVLVFYEDPRGFAWMANQVDLVGRDALIVSHAGETAGLLQSWAPYFERFEPVGTYPMEPGNPNSVDVTRGVRLTQAYPLPYGLR